jgi:hypothetical protein
METTPMSEQSGPKFYVNIEGSEHEWKSDSISVSQLRELGNIPTDQQIVEEAPDGSERTLAPNEIIQLKPGHRFGRAPRYKRGK